MTTKRGPLDGLSKRELVSYGGIFLDLASKLLAATEEVAQQPQHGDLRPLLALIDQWQTSGVIFNELAASKRPGRKRIRPSKEDPEASPRGRPTNALMPGYAPLKPKKPRGRPAKWGDYFDQGVYHLVERNREELRSNRKSKPTIKAAIDVVNGRCAIALGYRATSYVKDAFNSTKAAYSRGKKLALAQSKVDEIPIALK